MPSPRWAGPRGHPDRARGKADPEPQAEGSTGRGPLPGTPVCLPQLQRKGGADPRLWTGALLLLLSHPLKYLLACKRRKVWTDCSKVRL